MALTIPTDELPAISLTLVKPAKAHQSAIDLSPTNGNEPSRAELMQMIYKLMLLVGQNMSIIQNSYAQNQMDQEVIAQNQATATQTQTSQYLDKQDELTQQQEKAQGWQTFAEVMKWVGVGVGLLVGALLCETPLGFIVLAAVIAYTASPLFDKTVSALGGAIGKAIGSPTWGNIIAQAIILVVLTVVTCGAEGLSTGLTKLASTAGEDAIESGTQAAAQATKQISEEISTEISEEITEETANGASKETEQAASKAEENSSKVSAKDFKPRWSYASASVFSQTLLSTNMIQEGLQQVVDQIPGGKNCEWAKILVQIVAVIADLAIAFVSFKGAAAGEGTDLMEKLNKVCGNPTLLKAGIGSFEGATQLVTATANGGKGYYTYAKSQIQAEIAPLQANVLFGEGFFQVLTQLTSTAQQLYKSLMHANTILFNTNFSADWQACVAAQQYQG